jgi:hypothetical protein
MMTFRVTLTLLAILCCQYLMAQDFLPKLSTTPEAATLGKFGEIPISEYTGVPSIKIPLYSIKEGGVEVPTQMAQV